MIPNNHSILLVEDDVEVAALVDRILKKLDEHIFLHWCTSAEEALSLVKKSIKSGYVNPFRIILADHYLDGVMTGLELIRYCEEFGVKASFLLFSSVDLDQELFKVHFKNPLIFLKKPFLPRELEKKMYQLLHFENKAISE